MGALCEIAVELRRPEPGLVVDPLVRWTASLA
jgi:hypothetical protein